MSMRIRSSVFRRLPLALAVACGLLVPAGAQTPEEAHAMWSQATLYRDDWGTPHIYADNPRALGFAFGYAQAEDHIEAMLMAYRTANGRAAEVLGEKMVVSDEFAIRMGHARLAAQALEAADEATVALCTGFAMGANTWLLEHQDSVPDWADGVKPSDPLALWHAFVTSMAPLDLPNVPRPPRAMETGNAWAIAPERTEEGKAILVINPHNYFDGPFRWYEAHLALNGMDIAGATLFGLPLIVQGHNGALGWAFTPNFPDTADVFQEEFQPPVRNPKDPRVSVNDSFAEEAPMLEYLAHAQPYFVRTPEGLSERAAPGMTGLRGPIFDDGGALYSWTVGGFGDFGAFSQLLAMASAQDLGAFQEALTMQQIPCFNVVYADREGNVLFLYNAKAGTREVPPPASADPGAAAPEINWARPVSARLFTGAWGATLPMDALPSVLNPASGYVQACGGPPWACTDDAPIDAAAYPAWFIQEPDTYRARRVRQLLRAGTRTFRDMQSMLYDVVAPAASEIAPLLLEMAGSAEKRVEASHPDLETGLQLLRDWNHTAETAVTGMTFYHVWWNLLTAKHAADFPNAAAMYDALAARSPAAQEAALAAATDAARLMRNDLDTMEVPWGEVHRVVRGEKDYPMPGAVTGEPIFVASDHEYGAGKWRANYGYGLAMAVEFGEAPEAVSVSAFGASEDPSSPHFADQLELMLARRFKRTRFLERDVLRYAASAMGQRTTFYPLGAEGRVQFASDATLICKLDSSPDAPAPLPPGLAAFTVFVRPIAAPVEAPLELAVALAVPPEVCAAESLRELALYGYDESSGWTRVDPQAHDSAARAFSATVSQSAAFAVLGPETALIKPETPPPSPPVSEKPVQADGPAQLAPPATENSAERNARGVMSLKLKGGYDSVTPPPSAEEITKSDRGVRVLRLKGDDLAEMPQGDGSGAKGKALWVEGLPKGFDIETALNPPAEEASAEGTTELRLRGGYTPGVDAAAPVAAPEPGGASVQNVPAQQEPQQRVAPVFSPEGTMLGAPQPPEVQPQEPAAPVAEDQRPLSRKEKKRLKQQQQDAAPVYQEFSFTPQGFQMDSAGNPAAPPDSFGDVPDRKSKRAKDKPSKDDAPPAKKKNFGGRP
jgi:acyl-homoserine-lactone acylase